MKQSESFVNSKTSVNNAKPIICPRKVINMIAFMESRFCDYSKMEDLMGAYAIAPSGHSGNLDMSVKIPSRTNILKDLDLIDLIDKSNDMDYHYLKKPVEASKNIIKDLLKAESLSWDCLENKITQDKNYDDYCLLCSDLINFDNKDFIDVRMYLELQLDHFNGYFYKIEYKDIDITDEVEFLKGVALATDSIPTLQEDSDTKTKLAYLFLAYTAISTVLSAPNRDCSLECYKKIFLNVCKNYELK